MPQGQADGTQQSGSATQGAGAGAAAGGANNGGQQQASGQQQQQTGAPQGSGGTLLSGDQGGANNGGQQQDAGANQQQDGAPAELELKLPEGFDPKDPAVEKFRGVAKEIGLKSEAAQKLFDHYVAAQQESAKAAQTRAEAEFKQTREAWVQGMRRDPEIGLGKWDATVSTARKAVEAFADKDLKDWLGKSGLSDFPPLVRLFAKVGAAISEDSVPDGGAGSGAKPAPIKDMNDLARALGYVG